MTEQVNENTALNMFMGADQEENEFSKFTITAQMTWEMGFVVFISEAKQKKQYQDAQKDTVYFFPYDLSKNTKEARGQAFAKANDFVSANGILNKKGKDARPFLAMRHTIKGDDVPSSDDGRYEHGDRSNYHLEFADREGIAKVGIVLANMNGDKPIDGTYLWCKTESFGLGTYSERPKRDENGNNVFDDKGAEVMETRENTIQVPIAFYATRDEAVADMEYTPKGLSEKAIKEGGYNMNTLKAQAETISADVKAYMEGTKPSMQPKASDPMSYDDAAQATANDWLIEPSDIELLEG